MNILEKVHNLAKKLGPRDRDPIQKAWWILESITKKKQFELLTHDNFELSRDQINTINDWLDKHVNHHMPLQYLIGSVPFYNIEVLTEPPILIPRPETESWCYELIQKLICLQNKKINILDMATGSGCIAISLAKALPAAKIYGVDISEKAIALAAKNLIHNEVLNVKLIKSDLFKELNGQKFDIIVSNPPYIDPIYFDNLDLSVKNWEDQNALICEDRGLHIIKKIIDNAPRFLSHNQELMEKNIPQLVLEIDRSQGEEVSNLFNKNGFKNINIAKDLAGKDRVVSAGR